MTIQYQGKTLTLIQEPFPDTVNLRIGDTVEVIDGEVWRADAEDSEGNPYRVYWTALDAKGEPINWQQSIVLPV